MGYNFFGLALELEKILHKRVDLITYKYINPHIKKYIFQGEVKVI